MKISHAYAYMHLFSEGSFDVSEGTEMGSCHRKKLLNQERFFLAFVCDSHQDSELLKSIMRRVIDSRRHPVRDCIQHLLETQSSDSRTP